MRKLLLVSAALAFLAGCNTQKEKKEEVADNTEEMNQEMAYASFGEEISDTDVMTFAEAAEKYKSLKVGDTVPLKFSAKVKEVCQNKGCWMRLDLGSDEAMVKFKDYGFFVPKDIAGDEVILEGMAFVDEMSIEDQKHYAEDAGKPQDEIDAITEPKRTLSFVSSGVLIAENQ